MPTLRIVAAGDSEPVRSQRRGKLFEGLMASVLRGLGYHIDRILNVNYAGMEIDIEGHSIATMTPLYAECKCYDTAVSAPRLMEFFGKYMSRWMKDEKAQGLFIALPGINSHARAFYNETCKNNSRITVRVYEEEAVLNGIYEARLAVRPLIIEALVKPEWGKCGDQWLIYSNEGLFWVQLVISADAGFADSIMIFDHDGDPVHADATLGYLTELCPEISQFQLIEPVTVGPSKSESITSTLDIRKDEIVQVRGSSAWFEYQFPASPEYFVGRSAVLDEVQAFATSVLTKQTSCRGLLFEASSGWGKSSVVLSSIARLREGGHKAIAIDCRSTSTSAAILQIVEYCLNSFRDAAPDLFSLSPMSSITGFHGAMEALVALGKDLEKTNQLAVVFLDQFENMFFLPDALRRVRDLLLGVCDAQTNIVFGFAWKSDLISTANEFPFQLREEIAESSVRLSIATFSEIETNALLEQLSRELRTPIRKDLRFLLSEFSQGYPWLLKKLCAHVKSQRENGVPQSEIANRVLNIEELFQEDLGGLSHEQEDALRRIARLAPAAVRDLNDQFTSEVLQSLVNRRLIVRIGHKYDVYWDIFRDYLNTGGIPVQENYILRVLPSMVIKATKILADAGGSLGAADFLRHGRLSQHSAYNVIRDMRLLGIASVAEGRLTLKVAVPRNAKENEVANALRTPVRDRLIRNRLVSRLNAHLKTNTELSEDTVAVMLTRWCPYVDATQATWRSYAHILSSWMDISDVCIYETRSRKLIYYEPGTELRKRDVIIPTRRAAGVPVPGIQYMPVEKLSIELAGALEGRGRRPDFSRFKKSTLGKAMSLLEDLHLVTRSEKSLRLSSKLAGFPTMADEQRRAIFAEAIVKMESFALFLEILEEQKSSGGTHLNLGKELRRRTGADWKDGTAGVNAKIMLDWARHTQLAPGVFRQGKSQKMPAKPDRRTH